MNIRLLLLMPATLLGSTLLVGGGTYALLTGSISNGPNEFSTFQAGTLDIQNAPAPMTASPMRAFALNASNTQQLQFPMFYDTASFPSGQNPYDSLKGSPSGEIPGGFAPGDSVTRYWSVDNKGDSAKLTELSAKLGSLTGPSGTISPGSPAYADFLKYMNVSVYSPEDNYATPVFNGDFQELINGTEPLSTIMYLAKGSQNYQPKFVVTMDKSAGNDLQAVRGVLDFTLSAEQCQNNCFDPPFSNRDYSMKIGSTTPIKFECYDSKGNLINDPNVKLVITGPRLGGGSLILTYSLGSGLSLNGGHYQAQVYGDPGLFVQGGSYTATVYEGSVACCQKNFSTDPGNRSNA